MLAIEIIALVLVIVGIVVVARYNTWGGIALIVVGVLVFLLRNQLAGDNGANNGALLIPALFLNRRSWSKLLV